MYRIATERAVIMGTCLIGDPTHGAIGPVFPANEAVQQRLPPDRRRIRSGSCDWFGHDLSHLSMTGKSVVLPRLPEVELNSMRRIALPGTAASGTRTES